MPEESKPRRGSKGRQVPPKEENVITHEIRQMHEDPLLFSLDTDYLTCVFQMHRAIELLPEEQRMRGWGTMIVEWTGICQRYPYQSLDELARRFAFTWASRAERLHRERASKQAPEVQKGKDGVYRK